jgi:hypothetical protein
MTDLNDFFKEPKNEYPIVLFEQQYRQRKRANAYDPYDTGKLIDQQCMAHKVLEEMRGPKPSKKKAPSRLQNAATFFGCVFTAFILSIPLLMVAPHIWLGVLVVISLIGVALAGVKIWEDDQRRIIREELQRERRSFPSRFE